MLTHRFLAAASLAVSIVACSQGDVSSDATAEAQGAQSAADVTFDLMPIVEGLEFPWGIEFLPDSQMLITEREGRLNLIRKNLDRVVVSGLPEAYVERQGGYFDVRQDPDFEKNRTIYLAYAKGTDDANATAIFKGKLSLDGTEITDGEDIYQADMRDTAFHYGGRMRFLPDGTLVLSLGDGFRYMEDAQSAENTHGTIVRINTDGSVPEDNPLIGVEGAAEEVYSWGHRNVQGLLYDVHSDTLFAHEHGPKGGDELNVIVPGQNYGWPRITYGVNYDGTIITTKTAEDGLEQPRTKWVPSIAPSGLTRYTGGTYPEWTGGLLIGAMNGPAGQKLVHIELDGTEVVRETDYLTDLQRPIRDVNVGVDGFVYIATNELDGGVYRIVRNETQPSN